MKFIATDIEWDVDKEELLYEMSDVDVEKAAKLLQISANLYMQMSTSERQYCICENGELLWYPLFNLPSEYIGETDTDDYDSIVDLITDEFGYCIKYCDIDIEI